MNEFHNAIMHNSNPLQLLSSCYVYFITDTCKLIISRHYYVHDDVCTTTPREQKNKKINRKNKIYKNIRMCTTRQSFFFWFGFWKIVVEKGHNIHGRIGNDVNYRTQQFALLCMTNDKLWRNNTQWLVMTEQTESDGSLRRHPPSPSISRYKRRTERSP